MGHDHSASMLASGLAQVRARPALYIGGTGAPALSGLVFEVLANALAEADAGHGKRIEVTIGRDQRATVRDYGRGIPFDIRRTASGAIAPHATLLVGQIDPDLGGALAAPALTGGLGAKIVNALSAEFEVTSWRTGRRFTQRFRRGVPEPHAIVRCDPSATGTRVRWRHDDALFYGARYDLDIVREALETAVCLHPGLTIVADLDAHTPEQSAHTSAQGEHTPEQGGDDADHRGGETFAAPDGLADLVRRLQTAPPLFPEVIAARGRRGQVKVTLALRPGREDGGASGGAPGGAPGAAFDPRTAAGAGAIRSYANGIRTIAGGTHERGLHAAIERVANRYALQWGIVPRGQRLRTDVLRYGLTAALTVSLPLAQFQSQTKDTLNNPEAEGAVRDVAADGLALWFSAHPNEGRAWLGQAAARQAADDRALRAMVTVLVGAGPGVP